MTKKKADTKPKQKVSKKVEETFPTLYLDEESDVFNDSDFFSDEEFYDGDELSHHLEIMGNITQLANQHVNAAIDLTQIIMEKIETKGISAERILEIFEKAAASVAETTMFKKLAIFE